MSQDEGRDRGRDEAPAGMREEDRLREDLRAADPAAGLPPVGETGVRRLLDATTARSADAGDPAGPGPVAVRRGRLTAALVAAAAVLVLGVGGLVVAVTSGGDEGAAPVTAPQGTTPVPTAGAEPVVLAAPDGRSGRCMVPSAATLARADVALDGTVVEVDGDEVLLQVGRWYAGGSGASRVLLQDSAALARLLGGVTSFEPGQRYLVSAVDGRVTVCGFSAPWSPGAAALYEEAFGS